MRVLTELITLQQESLQPILILGELEESSVDWYQESDEEEKSSSKESDELFDSRILNNSSCSLSLIFNMLNLFFNLPGFLLQSLLYIYIYK